MMTNRPCLSRAPGTPLTRILSAVLLAGLFLTASALANVTGHRGGPPARRCHHHRRGHCKAAKAHLTRLTQLTAAPHVRLSGMTISWRQTAGIKSYVLARKEAGSAYAYSTVTGSSVTPLPLPGKTIHYWLRTDASGSAWSQGITVSYPDTLGSSASADGSITDTQPSTEESHESTATATQSQTAAVEDVNVEAPIAASDPFVKGVDTNMQGWGVEAAPQIAAEMHTLGASWEREDLAWSAVEPQRGAFNWSSFDHIVAAAEANGITILPVVGYAPSWTSPSNAADYASFLKAAVERYGPGTSANLKWWELWNEPYAAYAWSGRTPDAEEYARDALAAAEAAKSVSLSVKLLIAAEYNDSPQTGGSSPWQTTWVDDMFAAAPTLGQWFAGVAVHPYGGDPGLSLAQPGSWKNVNGEWAFQRIDTIRAQLLAHGVNLPFWVTEDGWSTWEVSEAAQAQNYADLIKEIAARPWIRALFPYCLREFDPKPTNNESGFGLLKFGNWEPKPAFYTLQSGFKALS